MAKGPPGRDAAGLAGTLTPRRRWPDLASTPGPLIHHPPRPVRQVAAAQQARERLTLARLASQLGCRELNSAENHQNSVTGRFTAARLTTLVAGRVRYLVAAARAARMTASPAGMPFSFSHSPAPGIPRG